ncbi:histone transcription regulator 3 homolog isoform X4 [Drosophila subobscura]|uniref:histone transcription regulator 3 homolog isoform X4 n=1 Tax=Drosophila subobscura TaxID=7241 RepID=UPI00155B01D9|nr:histone transcription regulator 3 homolog isoform X4 [Drosophila subobscura]
MVGKNFKALAQFHRLTEYIVQCKHCDKTLSSKHTSSNLTRHLLRNHKLLARQIFAGEEGKMLAELKDELEAASANEDIHMNMDDVDGDGDGDGDGEGDGEVEREGETKTAVRTIIGGQQQLDRQRHEAEMRNKEPFYEYVVDNTVEAGDKHDYPESSDMHDLVQAGSASLSETTTQMDEKLKAETIYFNEMAELARSKRRLIDLQTKKLLLDMNVVDN